MRLAFFLLTAALLLAVGWTAWKETHPTWMRYQAQLTEMSEEYFRDEIQSAERDLASPEVQQRIASIERDLETLEADTTGARLRVELRERRLPELRDRVRQLRAELRSAEAGMTSAEVAAEHRARLALLELAERAYAEESGKWPPDESRLERTRAVRDSLRRARDETLAPIDHLVQAIDSLRVLETDLYSALSRLEGERTRLVGQRAEIFSRLEAAQAGLARVQTTTPAVREIASPDGRTVSRCPTCHGALGDVPSTHPSLPNGTEFVDVGCVVCHRGNGRALDVERAHEGLIAGDSRSGGAYSIRARIDMLTSADVSTRARAMEELRQITGIDPGTIEVETDEPELAEALAWIEWWKVAQRYFESADPVIAGGTRITGGANSFGPAGAAGAGGLGATIGSALGSGGGASGGNASGGAAGSGSALGVPSLVVSESGFDPFEFSTAGRRLRYVGSRECIGCHRTTHREHTERWLDTKFRSLDRLADVADPRPCYACHATGYDPATGRFAEGGVTCEACHGPGEIYSQLMFSGAELNGRGETGRGRELLDASARMAREGASARLVAGDAGPMNQCVACHHPRRHAEGGPSRLETQVDLRNATLPEDPERMERR